MLMLHGTLKTSWSRWKKSAFACTGGKDIAVAYDSDLLYPYWWYFRDYPNKRLVCHRSHPGFTDSPIILVASDNFGKIEPVVGMIMSMFEYTRLWWPTQVYYDLTFERVWNAITDSSDADRLMGTLVQPQL